MATETTVTQEHWSLLWFRQNERSSPRSDIDGAFSEWLTHLANTSHRIRPVAQSADNLTIRHCFANFCIIPKSYVIKLTSIIMNFMHTSHYEISCNFPPFLHRSRANTQSAWNRVKSRNFSSLFGEGTTTNKKNTNQQCNWYAPTKKNEHAMEPIRSC